MHLTKESLAPSLQTQGILKEPSTGEQGRLQDRRYFLSQAENQFSSLPTGKAKRHGTPYSTGHYVSKGAHLGGSSSRGRDGICVQQIKPDAWCYSPVHYERENDMSSRMQNMSIQPSSRTTNQRSTSQSAEQRRQMPEQPSTRNCEQPSSRTRVYAVEEGEVTFDDDRRHSPHLRQIPSKTIYISPPKESQRMNGYESSQDTLSGQSSRRRPKVFYAGNCPQFTGRDQGLSSARSIESLDTEHSAPARSTYEQRPTVSQARQPYGQRPAPAYVAAPSYNYLQPNNFLKSQSASSLVKPRHKTSYSDPSSSSPKNVRQIQARPSCIPSRPLCERCHQIPIERQQRICAACESDLKEKHRVSTARLY